jgi:hypothetical protein
MQEVDVLKGAQKDPAYMKLQVLAFELAVLFSCVFRATNLSCLAVAGLMGGGHWGAHLTYNTPPN